MDQLSKDPSAGEKAHLGQLAKQVIENHMDRFVIFTINKQYLTIAIT